MKHAFLVCCWLFTQTLLAQTLPYALSVQQGVYTPLANGISAIDGSAWDDPEFEVPLGFNFQFFGQTTSSLSTPSDFSASAFGLTTDPTPLLISYGGDLIDRGFDTGESLSPIVYQVDGAAGSRIFKIEWANAGFYYDPNNADFTNVQLWLFEGSNNIELHFGPNQVADPAVYEFTGPIFGFMHKYSASEEEFDYLWYLAGAVENPTIKLITSANADTLYETLTGAPSDGLIYRFGPNVVGVDDLRQFANQVRVFPSLASESVTIAITDELASKQQDMHYEIVDQLGQKIRNAPFVGVSSQVDIAALPKGLYLINLWSSSQIIATKKIVKQ